ncbi:MAG: hypothetical protein NTY11_02300 [Candidatus Parcubacteria bacterium]|nr:hypothetical protein [Candidatus Parcubacteria bacterium]
MPEVIKKPKAKNKPEALETKGMMNLVIAVVLDIMTLICAFFYTLGAPGMFFGEVMSYIPKILSVIFLGGWSFSKKKISIKNTKVLLKLIPVFGDLPLNTFNQLGMVGAG